MATVVFYKFYHSAPPILRADKSALGTMPAAAFQYCEAMRSASAFGWHVFPPKDIHLFFDGKEAFFYEDEQWYPIKSTGFEKTFQDQWNEIAPEDLAGKDPPFLTELFVPGYVQIWSGYFVSSAPGWSVLVRPVVNYNVRSSFDCTEGLVETDTFYPMPLFMNVKLNATDREIYIPKGKPLFQVQPVKRESYKEALSEFETIEIGQESKSDFPWSRYFDVVREKSSVLNQPPGRYAVSVRKRNDKG